MDQKAEGAAHRFAEEEAREALQPGGLPDGAEVGEAVAGDGVDVGNEGAEALGAAVAREVEGEAGEPVLGEEDGGGLEGPADVVAVAVDHTDQGSGTAGWGTRWRNLREPGAGEKGNALPRGVEGTAAVDALGGVVVVFLRRVVSPEVAPPSRRLRRRHDEMISLAAAPAGLLVLVFVVVLVMTSV